MYIHTQHTPGPVLPYPVIWDREWLPPPLLMDHHHQISRIFDPGAAEGHGNCASRFFVLSGIYLSCESRMNESWHCVLYVWAFVAILACHPIDFTSLILRSTKSHLVLLFPFAFDLCGIFYDLSHQRGCAKYLGYLRFFILLMTGCKLSTIAKLNANLAYFFQMGCLKPLFCNC
jgi:hypothetical protein